MNVPEAQQGRIDHAKRIRSYERRRRDTRLIAEAFCRDYQGWWVEAVGAELIVLRRNP